MPNELTKTEPLPPQAIIDDAKAKAKILKAIVTEAHLAIQIGATQHLKFEAWQTLGRFANITAGIEWTKPLQTRAHDIIGYEARAVAYRNTNIISAAEAQCTQEESNWKNKELWQLRSMAQTRACSKALRNVLAWIVVLAGYEATPAEEAPVPTPIPKQSWTAFWRELKQLGISAEQAYKILGVASIKQGWIEKQHRTLDDALATIKAHLAQHQPPEEQ